jgi:membrane protein DedA with SNARE-associated domain
MAQAGEPAASDGDTLLAPTADADPKRSHSRFDRAILRGGGWLAEHRLIRACLVVVVLLGALIPGVALLIFPDITNHAQGFDYGGIFLTNLLSTSTVVIPVPGLTATAQALIIREGKHAHFPWLVGLVGGAGMGLGEITLYYAGYLGAELARGRELPGPAWLRQGVSRVAAGINWLMDRWGMTTLFVLSAVPNPFFEVAGLTAGSVRISFRRFLLAALAGKLLRGVLLAYLGYKLPFV